MFGVARALQTYRFVARHLFIVSRETPYLADYMREQFRDEPCVEVIVDRRHNDRRPARTSSLQQATSAERRTRHDVEIQLRQSFHAFVTLD